MKGTKSVVGKRHYASAIAQTIAVCSKLLGREYYRYCACNRPSDQVLQHTDFLCCGERIPRLETVGRSLNCRRLFGFLFADDRHGRCVDQRDLKVNEWRE